MKLHVPVAAAWIGSAAIAGAALAQPAIRTVDGVDLERYAGTWYEIARLPNRFQDQCAGNVVARYALRPDGRIDVVNSCRTAAGALDEARGIARVTPGGGSNTRLKVRFAPAVLSFLPTVWGDYWIIGLAPDYHWAVVGEPSRRYLWILARSTTLEPSSLEQAREIATANGYDVVPLQQTTHAQGQ